MSDEEWPTCENSAHLEHTKFRPQCYKGAAKYEVDIDRQPDERGGVDTLLLCDECHAHVSKVAPADWEMSAYYL